MNNIIDITPHLENKKAMDNFKKAEAETEHLGALGFMFGDVIGDLEKLVDVKDKKDEVQD